MTDNEYSGPVNVEGMLEFLYSLEGEVEVLQSSEGGSLLMDDVDPHTAAEYLEGVTEGGAKGLATPWRDYEGNGLLDPESLEPWEAGDDSYTGRLQLQSQELTEDGVSYRFDFKAEDEEGEEWDISMTGIEEYYNGTGVDMVGNARMSKAFREVEL